MKLRIRDRTTVRPALPADWRASVPDRPQRPRRVKDGRLVPIKSDPVSRKVRIVTGIDSRAIRGELDQRFAFAKMISTYEREYREHVGSDSVVLQDLCRSAAIHKAVFNLALSRLSDAGPLDGEDGARAAYEAWRRADADLRDVLRLLGLERKAKEVPDLRTYIAHKAQARAE